MAAVCRCVHDFGVTLVQSGEGVRIVVFSSGHVNLKFVILKYLFQAYSEWQEHPVLTTVSTTGKPIKDIEFPAITICSQGAIKEVWNGK